MTMREIDQAYWSLKDRIEILQFSSQRPSLRELGEMSRELDRLHMLRRR